MKNKKLAVLVIAAVSAVAIISCIKNSSDKLDIEQDNTPEYSIYMEQGELMTVKATAYCGDTITSTGTVPLEGQTIAVDPKIIPYGTRVYIPQFDRIFIAEDCGSAIKENKIDIFMNDYNKCIEWGVRTIDIYILY